MKERRRDRKKERERDRVREREREIEMISERNRLTEIVCAVVKALFTLISTSLPSLILPTLALYFCCYCSVCMSVCH